MKTSHHAPHTQKACHVCGKVVAHRRNDLPYRHNPDPEALAKTTDEGFRISNAYGECYGATFPTYMWSPIKII